MFPTSQSEADVRECLRRQEGELVHLRRQVTSLQAQKDSLIRLSARLREELRGERRASAEWDHLFDNALDLLVLHDTDGRLVRVSPSVQRLLGYTPNEMLNLDLADIVHPDDLKKTLENISGHHRGGHAIDFLSRCRHKSGEWRWLAWTTPAPSTHAPDGCRLLAVARDVTGLKLAEETLRHQAHHDALTGLANRAAFDDTLAQALARAERSVRGTALLLIDLDGFKAINDHHGHPAGDAVLSTVANRLSIVQRKGDFVARLGGDEFACLFEDAHPDSLNGVATRILAALSEEIVIGKLTVMVGCSIGIAYCVGGTMTAAEIYKRADEAMYEAKRAGKRGFATSGY